MKKIILLVIAFIILVALFMVFNKKTEEPEGKLSASTFSGIIQAVDTSCFSDGVCSVTVDGRKVVLLTGMRIGEIPPVGKLMGVDSIGDLEGRIGDHANVYATKTPEGDYTLYGSEDYYVEVVKMNQ